MNDGAPTRPLRVLHLEDSNMDNERAMAHLQRAGLEVEARRIESRSGIGSDSTHYCTGTCGMT